MKIAVYIEQGVTQLVLTPENEWEKSVLRGVPEGRGQLLHAYRGSFYQVQGGYFRNDATRDDSLILRVESGHATVQGGP